MTITIELLREDAMELVNRFELLSILRVKKTQQPSKGINDITQLFGTLKLKGSSSDLDEQASQI